MRGAFSLKHHAVAQDSEDDVLEGDIGRHAGVGDGALEAEVFQAAVEPGDFVAVTADEIFADSEIERLVSFRFEQREVADVGGRKFGWVEDLDRVDFKLAVTQETQRFFVAGWIKKIAEHEDEAASFHALRERSHTRQQLCRAVGSGGFAEKIEHGVKMCFAP